MYIKVLTIKISDSIVLIINLYDGESHPFKFKVLKSFFTQSCV